MRKERILAVVIDHQQLTLYREDGSSFHLPQGDPRVRPIVEQVLPVVQRGGVAEIDFESSNPYGKFEEKSGGLVRFFRAAKDKIKDLFSGSEERPEATPGSFGAVPKPTMSMAEAVEEIITNAKPVANDDFRESEHTSEETMVAVVGEGSNAVAVPGIETVRSHVEYSAKIGSTIGMENFLKRVGAVIGRRGHTVQELLKFLEKADLPIANDGSIIAYKVLSRRDHYYVDCHTKNVTQTIGSFVCMDEKLVDPSRRTECSTGLHIARRGYIRSFVNSGDVGVLVKIAPEDVIAVPLGEPDKMRVRGYHILFELPWEDVKQLSNKKPITNSASLALINRAIAGDHPAPKEQVMITGAKGQGVTITPWNKTSIMTLQDKPVAVAMKAPKVEHKAIDDPSLNEEVQTIEPKQIKELAKAPAEQAEPTPEAPAEASSSKPAKQLGPSQSHARMLFEQKSWNVLHAFKQAKKKSWEALGFAPDEIDQIVANIPKKEPKP